MKKITRYIQKLTIALALVFGVSFFGLAGIANAAPGDSVTPTTGSSGGNSSGGGTGINVFQNCDTAGGTTSGQQICGAKDDPEAFTKMMTNIINAIFFVLGMIAVIMIIVGGVKYTTSNGDPQGIKSAKDTIMYAVIGLVVAILAYTIVNFVVASLGK